MSSSSLSSRFQKSCLQQKMGRFLLTLVRHGETEYNRKKLLQGQIDIPLNDTGLKQADALGKYLARERLDHVYSSDLSRCVQTAEGVMRNAAVPRPTMMKDARLRERHFGEAEGRSRGEAYNKSRTGKGTFDPVGAETPKQVVDRGLSFIRDLCLDVHKEYGHVTEYRSKMIAGVHSVEEQEEMEVDESFEVVFARDDKDTRMVGTCSSDITQNSTHGTALNDREDFVDEKMQQDSRTVLNHNLPESQSGTTSAAIGATAAVGSHSVIPYAPIFKSDITGISSIPHYCPHIFVSSHGYILRSLFQSLQKSYKIDIPGGNSVLRTGCPNTGLSTFVFTLDSDGHLVDIECYFVFAIDHLKGIDVI